MLGACYVGVTHPVIIETGTINYQRYIQKLLPLSLQDGQKLLGDEFIFQQDAAPAHTDQNTQKQCLEKFLDFWPKPRWPLNSPDLSQLDCSIWQELCAQMKWDKIKNKKTN